MNLATTEAEATSDVAERFHQFIRAADFPCVGAKSALGRGTLTTFVARDIGSAWDDLAIAQALLRFADADRAPADLASFAVLFEHSPALDEEAFERLLWARIQSISDKDAWLGQPYDAGVSPDPSDPHFSLSFGGRAFFVVGLHPGASRRARRFDVPVMVFNLHDQFERLREQNRYERMREAIIARDIAYSGSANPMLSRHGETSEARQYSGRAVDAGWTCPFSRKGAANDAD